MGLGKTIQAIAFISAILGTFSTPATADISFFFKKSFANRNNNSNTTNTTTDSPNNNTTTENKNKDKKGKGASGDSTKAKKKPDTPVLVVMPAGVIQHWLREFKKVSK